MEVSWAGEGRTEVEQTGVAAEGAMVAAAAEAKAMVMETKATAVVQAVGRVVVKVETHMSRRTKCNRCQSRSR